MTALKEVFSDALLQGELPGYEELFEVADVAPNVASGIQKLHEGYRQALLRLSELNTEMSNGRDVSQTALPTDVVNVAMESRANYYDGLDRAAGKRWRGEMDFGAWVICGIAGIACFTNIASRYRRCRLKPCPNGRAGLINIQCACLFRIG